MWSVFFSSSNASRFFISSRALIIFPSHLNTSSAAFSSIEQPRPRKRELFITGGQFRRGIYDVIIKLNFIWLIPCAPSLYTRLGRGPAEAEIPSAPSHNLLRRVWAMAWPSFSKRTNLHSIQMRREEKLISRKSARFIKVHAIKEPLKHFSRLVCGFDYFLC